MLKHGGVFSKMKIKRMVKRLFAVGTGVVMLGATAMGAMAADLGNYPGMFVKDGVFDGYFVVGENAASVDNLAMTDIAASMKVASGGTTSTSVEGDAWLVGTSAKFLEMANSNKTSSAVVGESFRDINNYIEESELGALADGTWATNEADYDFQQFLYFDSEGEDGQDQSRVVKFDECSSNNCDSTTSDYLFFKDGRQIARYKLEFTSTAQSDITDSTGTADTTGLYLDDFENTEFSMLGKDYSVVMARRPTTTTANPGGNPSIKLTLMAGSTSDTLLEGESQTYTVKGVEYDVALTFVDDTNAKFTVNGESTNKLQVGETYVLADKSEIGVSEVLYQSYAGGVHSATFFVGASKVILQDDDVTDSIGAYNLKVGSEDIDGTTVIISGTDTNTTFSISTIDVNMTADSDYFVGAGEKLSEVIASEDDEIEVLMNGAFDVEYLGLEDKETNEIRLKTSSSKRYKLQSYDGDGIAVDIPIAYAEGNFNLSIGEESTNGGASRTNQNRLHIIEGTAGNGVTAAEAEGGDNIHKDDYFVLTDGTSSDGSAKSYLLQYKGADQDTKTSPKIKFKNMGSGDTLEYSTTTNSSAVVGTIATIKLGGYSFLVQAAGSMGADDYAIDVDLDGGGSIGTTQVTWVDYYGPEFTFVLNVSTNNNGSTPTSDGLFEGKDYIQLIMDTPNNNDYDNTKPSVINLNITASSDPEVRAALTGVTLSTPDGETDVSYGYTSMGAKVTFTEPSSDPDSFTIAYPETQALPQVYFTSGATATSSSASGNMVAVEVVDATKLDSEVADATAQNLIVIGGPCVNTVAAELLGNPADCAEGFTPGKARVKLFENGDYVAMLVAGYSGADTRLAGKVIANTNKVTAAGGMEVEIEGTTTADAVVGAPSVVEEVVDEVVETTE